MISPQGTSTDYNLLCPQRSFTSYRVKSKRFGANPRGVLPIMSGPYGEAPTKRGTFSRFQMYERVEMLPAEIYERVEKYVISVCKKAQKG